MKKYIYLLIGLIIFITLVSFAFKNPIIQTTNKIASNFFPTPTPKALTKVKIGYIINAAARPEVAVAIKNNLFKKHGLEVEVNEFSSGEVIAQGLIGGKLDLVLIGQVSYLRAAAAGAKIKSIGLVNSNTRWYFISKKEVGNIKSYCTTGKATEDYNRGALILKNLGVDINTLNIVNTTSIPLCAKALLAGSVDSLAMTEVAWENFKLQNKEAVNYKVIEKGFGEKYLEKPSAIIVMEDTLNTRQEVIENFSKAIVEANYWLKNHSEEEIEKEIVGLVKITPIDATIYSKIIKGQLEGIKFTQKISNLEAIRKESEAVSPKLKEYDVKNFLSTIISDQLTKQGFLEKYGF